MILGTLKPPICKLLVGQTHKTLNEVYKDRIGLSISYANTLEITKKEHYFTNMLHIFYIPI